MTPKFHSIYHVEGYHLIIKAKIVIEISSCIKFWHQKNDSDLIWPLSRAKIAVGATKAFWILYRSV